MKSYFKPLLSYLMNHPSLHSLPLVNREQQILSFADENKSAISLFLYPYFEEEVEDFKNFTRESTNETILPGLEPDFAKTILALFPVFYTDATAPTDSEMSRVLHHLLQFRRSREQLLFAFSFWEMGEASRLINGLFTKGDSYTVHLIESEGAESYTAKMILDFVKSLLFLAPLLAWYEEDAKVTFTPENAHRLSLEIGRRFVFLPVDLVEKAIDLNFSLKEKSDMASISKLGAILQEKARFPMLTETLSGSLSSEESWFAGEFTNPHLDKRILKELWESYKEWSL